MQTAPVHIPGTSRAKPESTQPTPRIAAAHRNLTLVLRGPDGTPRHNQSAQYAEAMAQCIETCARDIRRGECNSFESLWARACNTIANLYLARRDLPPDALPNRHQTNVPVFARLINELDPSDFVTLHAEHDWTQAELIEPRLLALVDTVRTLGDYDPAHQSWTLGDYALHRAAAPALLFEDEGPSVEPSHFELRIHDPNASTGYIGWRVSNGQLQQDHAMLKFQSLDQRELIGPLREQIRQLTDAPGARHSLAVRLNRAFEAYWWMLRLPCVAVGDKAQHVMQSLLLAAGHDLPPVPPGTDPALEALSRNLPDWLDHAPLIWGHGVRPSDLFHRELTGRLPLAAPRPTLPPQAPAINTLEAMRLSSSPGTRRRRAQLEGLADLLQANLKIG